MFWRLGNSKYALSVLAISLLAIAPLRADVLEGGVEKDDAATRLARPGGDALNMMPAPAPTFRIGRPMAGEMRQGPPLTGLVDTGAFTRPLQGSAMDNGGKLGLLSPAQFGDIPNTKFDLGAERGDRQLVLAWEAWHHQLSQAIYRRWSEVANRPGSATVRIVVYNNRQMVPMMVHSSGNPAFDRDLMASIMSLNGNPGLSFPARSQRPQVTFEADYVAASNIRPGFSWVKNDYEKVHEGY